MYTSFHNAFAARLILSRLSSVFGSRAKLVSLFLLAIVGELPNAQAQNATKSPLREVIYGHKDGLAMTYDVIQPLAKANGAAVVFVVSGGWKSMWTPPAQTMTVLAPFRATGYTCFAVRHGSSPRYSIKDAVADVRRSIRHIRLNADEYKIDADRIGVFGMSAGGHLTLMLATTGDDGNPDAKDPVDQASSRLNAGVAIVPPSDLTNYIWSTPGLHPQYRKFPGLDISKDEAESLSPLFFVTQDDAPCLIITGGKDTLVPPEQGRWIFEKMQETGVETKYVTYKNADHGLSGNQLNAYSEALSWFNKQLTKKNDEQQKVLEQESETELDR